MQILKDLMLKWDTDLEQIRTDFFANGGNCTESIRGSKSFIITVCHSEKISIWDFVEKQSLEIDNDGDYSDYQKAMVKASLLLAWEELERDNEELCFEIHKNAQMS